VTYSDEEAKRDHVEVLREEDVPVQFRTETMYAHEQGSQEHLNAVCAFNAWLVETHTFYYARPKDEFNEIEARQLAVYNHSTRLILEDMS